MTGITRDPESIDGGRFDVVVLGGGVYGVALTYEAVRRGLSVLMLEQADFGGATSLNNLRILHGGLRYLQRCDLTRFRDSVAERQWFLRHFPDLTAPVSCLMPLYGNGLRRPGVFRVALAANALLSRSRNRGVTPANHLPAGGVIAADAVASAFPGVRAAGLRGGAVWYDGVMTDPQRILLALLRAACAAGGVALNYVAAVGLVRSQGRVAGVQAVDRDSGRALEFAADRVINATGPWSATTAAALGDPAPALFTPTLAWNVLFDRAPLSGDALAVEPASGGRTYFLLPWNGRLLAGTGHAVWHGDTAAPLPDASLMDTFMADLNAAVPGLDLRASDVRRVFAGLLPGVAPGRADLSDRPVVIDHGRRGGPSGLFSVSGVKYTTARRVADRVLSRCVPRAEVCLDLQPSAYQWMPDPDAPADLARSCAEESVLHLDDLLLRRASSDALPADPAGFLNAAATALNWSQARKAEEIERLGPALTASGFAEPLRDTFVHGFVSASRAAQGRA